MATTYRAVRESCPEAQSWWKRAAKGKAASWYQAAGRRMSRSAQRIEHRVLWLPLTPGKWTEPRAPLSLLYIWQEHVTNSKKTEQSQGNRDICRKRCVFFAFVSAGSLKHLSPKVCEQVEKVRGWLFALPDTRAITTCFAGSESERRDESLFELPNVSCWDALQRKIPRYRRGLASSQLSPSWKAVALSHLWPCLSWGGGGDLLLFKFLVTERRWTLSPLQKARGG